MELKLYDRAAYQEPEPGWFDRWQEWRPRWVEEFERWAAPEVEPELEHEQERSFVPVAVLLGAALLVQILQFSIPAVRAYLEDRDILYRSSWGAFTLFKQWGLFVLMLVALRMKEERLASIGFRPLNAWRLGLAFVLIGFFLGAALVHRSEYLLTEGAAHWMVPLWAGERVLWVLLGVTAAVVEESFFRGFAIVWMYRWSRHLPLAVGFPAVVFAAGHAYMGWFNVAIALVGALGLSGLFLWRRDLYWPMVIHFLVNVQILLV